MASWRRARRGPALAVLVLLVAAAVPQFTWWRGLSLVWGVDGALPLRLSEIHQFFSITPATSSAPDVRKLPFLYPWGLFLGAWDKIGLPWNPSAAQHFFLFALLAASGLGALAWSRRLLPRLSLTTATIAALFYMFNPFALITVWSSQSNLMIHYSFLPVLGLAVMKLGERPSWRAACGVAVVWSLLMTPAYVTTPLLITDLVLIGLLLLRAAFLVRGGRAWGRILVSAGALFGTFLLLNSFWIWPLLSYYQTEFARGTASANNQSVELFALNSTPLSDALRLNGYWGLTEGVQGNPYYPWATYYYRSWASALAYLPMLLAACGLVFYPLSQRLRGMTRVERAGLLFAGLTASGLIVAVTGSHPPFGSLNTSVLTNLHLLDVFRSVYARFTEDLPLVMAPLLAAGLEALFWALRGSRAGRLRRARFTVATSCGAVLAVIVVLVVPWPMWSGAMFGGTGPVSAQRFDVPPSALSAGRFIDEQDGDFAVAAFPMGTSAMTYLKWPAGGYTGIQPYSLLTGKSVIIGDVGSPAATRLPAILSDEATDACRKLNSLNVRYVLLDRTPNLAAASWSSAVGTDVPATERALTRLPCLRLAHSSVGAVVYANEAWTAHRFFARSRAAGNDTETDLEYHRVLPGVYRVTLPRDRKADQIVVNTPPDGNWRMQGGTRVPDGDLTVFTWARSSAPASVLVWNRTEVVTATLVAVNVALTFALVLGRRSIRLAKRGYSRVRRSGIARVTRPSDDQQPS